MQISKIDENIVEVETTVPETTVKNRYEYEQLIQQKEFLTKRLAEETELFNFQIAEIDKILAECKLLGVSEKKIEIDEPAGIEKDL